MIQIKSINKSFGDQRILNDFNFHIPKIKSQSLPDEAVKSVLLKHLMGLIKPDRRDYRGQSLTGLDDFKLNESRKQFGMLFKMRLCSIR
jgi:ABC-type transporter Mla maintaining outer membrane lipid asymmetry ATPase subunit MlaF